MEFKGTPGPWRWEFNEKSQKISLCGGIPEYLLTVMDFEQQVLQGATPRFNKNVKNWFMKMEPAQFFFEPKIILDHPSQLLITIKHPDAHLISDAPDLLKQLYNLAILSIQSDRYNEDVDFKIEVDKSFSLIKKHAKI